MKQYILPALLLASMPTVAIDSETEGVGPSKIWLVVDDLAYLLFDDVVFDSQTQTLTVNDGLIENCEQLNGQPPVDEGGFVLVTPTQTFSLQGSVQFDLGRKAIIVQSLTDDLICDGAFEFDRIYFGAFD